MASSAVHLLAESVSKALQPPQLLKFSDWTEQNIRLSAQSSAAPGRIKLWKFQRGILDAIGDPLIERISVIKSARTGFTISLVASIGAYAVNDPGPIMLLMPTDDDARGIIVDEIDPMFRESPVLREVMRIGRFDGRNTLTNRTMLGGGSLKVISARAPRNLRRHTVKVLFCDEVDGMEVTKEGDPLILAEKRTTSFADRKIVTGSTPTLEATSLILKRYNQSDMRVFECVCPHCNDRFELLWECLDWIPGKPETVVCVCPHCGVTTEERYKPQMVEDGDWRQTAAHIEDHAGFRLNALISQFANAAWPKLVREYEQSKRGGDSSMQVFFNTVLGKAWSTAVNYASESMLMARVERFGVKWDINTFRWREEIPEEVAYITVGVDVQVDRLECVILGHSPEHRYILGLHVIYGNTALKTTWDELDAFLSTKWKHPLGGEIGVDAAGIDSGDGNRTQVVYDYCEMVQHRRIVAIKGQAGPRPIIRASTTRRRNRTATLFIIGVDQVKTDILVSLPLENTTPQSIRLSNGLEEEFFVQLTAERREIKYTAGRPEVTFARVDRRRAEALDATVYAIAVKSLIKIDFGARYESLKAKAPQKPVLKDLVSKLHGG